MVLKNLFTGRLSNGDTDIENRLTDMEREEEGSGWGTPVDLWRIHFNI